MSSAFDKLRRILALERDQGCRDRAVIGGLGRFLTYWEKEARSECSQSSTPWPLDDIVAALSRYRALPFPARAETLNRLLAQLDEIARRPAGITPPLAQTAPDSGAAPPASPSIETSGVNRRTPAATALREQETVLPPPSTPPASATASGATVSAATTSDATGIGATGIGATAPGATAPGATAAASLPAAEQSASTSTVAPVALVAPQSAPQIARPRAPTRPAFTLDSPVTALRGVNSATAARLAGLGIVTIRDLLYHLPRRYDNFGDLKPIDHLEHGDEVTVVGVVRSVGTRRSRAGQPILKVVVADATGSIEASWFNQPFLEKHFAPGAEVALSGKVDEYLGRLVLNSPEWEPLQRELIHTGRLVPIYPLTEGVGARWLRKLIKSAVDQWVPQIQDPLPGPLRQSLGLLDLRSALGQLHFPDDSASQESARRRLCFDELLMLQMGILRRRGAWRTQTGRAIDVRRDEVQRFVESLPFTLTGAQQRAIQAVLADLGQRVPMNRLLQGDVGSGKTVVAVAGVLATVRAGLQAAIMAPTSVLAGQHHRTVSQLLSGFPDVCVQLLVGSLSTTEKESLHDEIARGSVHVVIGTHALIQEAVSFERLGLVVVDEQHRFGVAQRGALRAKATEYVPHVLSMSATPIPRTLALTVYGDLDVSVLDELPPGRQRIVTAVRDNSSRERIYAFMRAQVKEGRQAFIICPLVEESEVSDARAAVSEWERLQHDVFPQLSLGLLHGRMRAEDKEQVMADFKAGSHHILVSTAVVEVGIDVPNATVMLVEGAERFGLAQLHQFRGRVGRGDWKSYCILLSEDPSEHALERLQVVEESQDGFLLAEKDLEWRGPGDVIGVRQHGLPNLRVARLSDTAILEQARTAALSLYSADPDLSLPEHAALTASVESFWARSNTSGLEVAP